MRVARLFLPAVLCLTLCACVSSLLIGNQLQNRLMWALLRPLVGFDPNQVNLFEIPQVQERMTSLLGEYYEPTVALLRTADQIQQEGALIYVTSRVLEEVVAVPLPEEAQVAQEQVEQVQTVQAQVEQAQQDIEEVQEQVAEVREQVQVLRSAAGMVWNGDTNQLAVVLVERGVSQVFAEQPQGAAILEPVWPASMQQLLEVGQPEAQPE
jgi:predicted transcriptional regulator